MTNEKAVEIFKKYIECTKSTERVCSQVKECKGCMNYVPYATFLKAVETAVHQIPVSEE